MTQAVPTAAKKYLQNGISLVLLVLIAPMVVWWDLSRPTGLVAPLEITISPGMTAYDIGALLKEKGLIRNATVFAWAARLHGQSEDLEAGIYLLKGTLTTPDILRELLRAPLQLKRVTIPEGLASPQIGLLLQQNGLADSARFVTLVHDRNFTRKLGIDAPSLEGYLFPQTYMFNRTTTEEEIIRRMLEEFDKVFTGSFYARLDSLKLSLNQALTVASIVEREAVVQKERALIAGVFLARLERSMMLESCPTVEYAMGYHKEHLENADLEIDSPYNTYKYPGLPPGPIANPGQASIQATLFPAKTDYLYFVARGDGTHVFSHTNEQHEAAKRAIRNGARL
ncbi:MAG: endolytic transglycosylase MltG [Candidatus Latescibacteria bacterium]|nr:endolytic transglycosylase MltG [Candidatus Latescibacterota bacterium]